MMTNSRPPSFGLAPMICCGVLGVAAPSRPSLAAPLAARCETHVELVSWMPLRAEVIERLVQARVLAPLLARHAISVSAAQAGAAQDVAIEIFGRIIEDSGEFSVYAAATPAAQHKRPSVAVLKTASILHQTHSGIQRIIEATAQAAGDAFAARLAQSLASLAPTLGHLSRNAAAEAFSVDLGTLSSASQPRFQALQGAKQARANHELAYCAMGSDPARGGARGQGRKRCLDALAQLARDSAFAQRAIIAVLLEAPPRRVGVFDKEWRSGLYHELRQQAFRLTTTFTGAALAEAQQAWLALLTHDYSDLPAFRDYREDSQLMEPISRFFERHPEVPNLQLAVARCSRTSHAGKGPDDWCRRLVTAMARFSQSTGDGSHMTPILGSLQQGLSRPPRHSDGYQTWLPTFQAALDADSGPLAPALVSVCIQRIQRAFYGPERARCIEALGARAPYSTEVAKTLVEAFLLADDSTVAAADQALQKLTTRHKESCPAVLSALAPVVARGTYPSYPHRPLVYWSCASAAR